MDYNSTSPDVDGFSIVFSATFTSFDKSLISSLSVYFDAFEMLFESLLDLNKLAILFN